MIIDLDEVKKQIEEYDATMERCLKDLKDNNFTFMRTRDMCLKEHKEAIEGSYNLHLKVFGQAQIISYGEEFTAKIIGVK